MGKGHDLCLRGVRLWQHRAGGKWDIYCPNGRECCLFTSTCVHTRTKCREIFDSCVAFQKVFHRRHPRSCQSVQTRLYQRVTQVQLASAQGITFPLPEGAHKHLGEVTAACFAFYPPPIPPAECQWSNPANPSNLLLEH